MSPSSCSSNYNGNSKLWREIQLKENDEGAFVSCEPVTGAKNVQKAWSYVTLCNHDYMIYIHSFHQNGWFIVENPIKIDDLGVPLFLETSIYIYIYTSIWTFQFGCHFFSEKRVSRLHKLQAQLSMLDCSSGTTSNWLVKLFTAFFAS